MSFDGVVYRVMIASAGDMPDVREAAEQAVRLWNSLHAEEGNAALIPLRWELDAFAKQGDYAQGVLNGELTDRCDLLLGLFWRRLGSKTKVSVSGTVEEIDRCLGAKKPVSLFERTAPIPWGETPDEESQRKELGTILARYKETGLVRRFETPEEAGDLVYSTLVHRIRELQAARDAEKVQAQTASTASDVTGLYKYQWRRDVRTINLLDGGKIGTGSIQYQGFGKNERGWSKTTTGIRFDGEDGGVELFLCADGNYRGTGRDEASVVLSRHR